MQLVDLCSESFGTRVECLGLESDDDPAKNLLDGGGPFLAERFVRPPLDLSFSLKKPRHIIGLVLGLNARTQRLTGADIFVSHTSRKGPEPIKIVSFGRREVEADVDWLLLQDRNHADSLSEFLGLSLSSDGRYSSSPLKLDLQRTRELKGVINLRLKLKFCANMPCLGTLKILGFVKNQKLNLGLQSYQ